MAINLTDLRKDRATWSALDWLPGPFETESESDQLRAQIVEVLSRDARPGDHALARYLLTEEVKSCKNSCTMGDPIREMVLLLSRFGDFDDLSLCWAAKVANGSTELGLQRGSLVLLGAKRTFACLRSVATDYARQMREYLFDPAGVDDDAFAELDLEAAQFRDYCRGPAVPVGNAVA